MARASSHLFCFSAVPAPSNSLLLSSLSNLRLPILSSIAFFSSSSSFKTHFSSSPSFSNLSSPIPPLKAPPFFGRRNPPSSSSAPSMVGNPRPQGKLFFSSGEGGSGEGESREILVQHLLLPEDDLKLLVELQQRIEQGTDLSDLALDHSICPSKDNGGMLGWVRKGQMVPEFEEAAFNAPLNKVVRCKTKFGWHLLQVLSEREASVLEDITPEELHSKLQDPNFIQEAQLIDVREPEEVEKASLPGFKVLPLRQFGTWGSVISDEFDPQKDTYVLCHHGMRSLQVAKWLQTQGFKRVFNISGGIHAYAVKSDSTIPTY